MNKKTVKILALLLTFALAFTLAACTKTPAVSDNPESKAPVAEPKTLVAGYDYFSQKFSPFFSKTAYDKEAAEITQLIIPHDRTGNVVLKGINGQVIDYNGTPYTYYSPADIDVVQNADGTVDYKLTMREDLVFSDGTPITIDDAIFCYYVFCDPAYDGGTTLYSVPITGINDFRAGVNSTIYAKYEALGHDIFAAGMDNTDFSNWTKDQQDAFWGDCLNKAGPKFVGEIVDYCVKNYASHMADVKQSEVALGMLMWGFGDVDDDGVFTTASGATFDLAAGVFPTLEDYWAEILDAYGLDFSKDGIDVESAGTSIEDFMVAAFITSEGPKDPEAGGEITSIAGIKRTGDYSLTITTDYFDATTIYNLFDEFTFSPLHYYGDVNQYDYANNKFGFPKGDLSIVKSKTTAPMGAGPYKFISYENGVISYEANPLYYKGEPKTKYVRFQEVLEPDKLSGLKAGTFDLINPSFSKDNVASIMETNSNGELTGNILTTATVDNLGYGYIGINADRVNVGGVPDSKESKALRSGLATVISIYRETVYNSYYGPRASVIQYPISNTSWAAPRPNDEGYRTAYSVDADGKAIYTDGMSIQDKEANALLAAITFFKAAGYTWDNATQKFTAAPKGASLSYEVIIPANGSGDHPSFGVLTAAKEALASIGISLEINDPADSNVLWTAIEGATQELWCAAWESTPDPDMYQVYHSSNIVGKGGTDSNHYAIADATLDKLMVDARQSADQSFRKATYKQCLDIILDWAVEIPCYQRQNAFVFSTERLKIDTLTPDITTFWKWIFDIDTLEVR